MLNITRRCTTFNPAQLKYLNIHSTANDAISPIFTNRNPRNLERIRIGYKPDGYYVEKRGKNFWHKLQIQECNRHITASIIHFQNGEVLKASTKEWAIKKHLYRTTDTSAYINLARVLALRCMESGLIELICDLEIKDEKSKIAKFLKTFQDEGIILSEPDQYLTILPWTRERPEKPWEITE